VFFGVVALGTTIGNGVIPPIISVFQGDLQHDAAVQEAKCEMQADEIYRTADKANVLLPVYVNRCMTVAGYDFIGMINSFCKQNFNDAAATAQLGQAGDYDMSTDSNCYEKHHSKTFW